MFELDGVKLTFTDEAINAIAKLTVKRKTGARGLRAIIEGVLMQSMFEAPSDPDITTVTVTSKSITDGEKPIFGSKKNKTVL